VHGLIVGGDSLNLSSAYGPYLHRLADSLSLSKFVTFTGEVADGARYLPAMDVLVNASHAEPFGIVLLEAMAAGIPSVAFDSGGPREIIQHESSGLLVAERSRQALARAIESLLADAELRMQIARRGRERFEHFFTAAKMTEDLTERLERLCC
jgi:glycosyltransferase involved in cell wall biosynthesis